GKGKDKDLMDLYKKFNIEAEVKDFYENPESLISWSDFVISRAGALSISELTFLNKPSVLVPSPNVAEDHQTKNAQVLAANGAAELINDSNAQNDLITESLKLVNEPKTLEFMSLKAAELAKPTAADDIVTEIFKLIK
ncbi:MAG: UDP-N-acetylglucosamine--N-acetylmuramyl-(pentapeptide) pyrophosphoryl-undecaprenol N-acetylglucosamine transferase, partial [Bacteroidia bacterium]